MGLFAGGVMLDNRTRYSRAVTGVTLRVVDPVTGEALPTFSAEFPDVPKAVTTNGNGAYEDFIVTDYDVVRLEASGVSQSMVSQEVLAGQARSLAQTVPTAAELPAVERDGSLRITQDDLHLHMWQDSLGEWEDLGPLQGEKGDPGPAGLLAGLVEVAPGAWQPTTDADTGWRVIDITDTAQSIRDGSGALHLRRTGFRVTARVLGAGLAAGTGAGFLFPNSLPTGFQARNVTGPAAAGELGGSGHVANRHRVHASSNDVYWCGWSNSSGAFSTSRVAGVTLQGEISWITDDPWPTTLPGTAL